MLELTEIDADLPRRYLLSGVEPRRFQADFARGAQDAEGLRYSFVTYQQTREESDRCRVTGFTRTVRTTTSSSIEARGRAARHGRASRGRHRDHRDRRRDLRVHGRPGAVNAGLYKNEAAIKKTEAANQWAYYQAKSNRQNLAELAVELVPEARKDFYRGEAERRKSEKAEIQKKAEELEKESNEWGEKTEQQIHEEHRWQQATTALQIAIALAAIALLTRSRACSTASTASTGDRHRARRLAWPAVTLSS